MRQSAQELALIWVGHEVDRQRRLSVRSRQDHSHRARNGLAMPMDQEGMNRPMVVDVPLSRPTVASDLRTSSRHSRPDVDPADKAGRARSHDFEMIS